jgi:cellobiose phosphorylase
MAERWEFTGEDGSFELRSPQRHSALYFPLANERGMMSCVTPTLGGDAKTGQNTFLLPPVSAIDLHDRKSGRNFWVYIANEGAWSVSGASARQEAGRFCGDTEESVSLRAGFLWHEVSRENARLGIRAEALSFAPAGGGAVELTRIRLINVARRTLKITPTAAVPVYGRSADNVRDHRHVTGLLTRAYVVRHGVEVKPSMSFDERGHRPNAVCYGVYGADGEGNPPAGAFPCLDGFVGEGGSLAWPEAVVRNLRDVLKPGDAVEGCEAVGALRFEDIELGPGERREYYLALTVSEGGPDADSIVRYLSPEGFGGSLEETKAFWEGKLGGIRFESGCGHFDLWMKWVSLQPVLRRIYGCSFLPHHDYGRGGRGWRDLWQDCLALLLLEPEAARPMLLNHFGGVRMDGTNATIIGSAPGEFVADRNNIARVWSDHAAWPFFTVLLYLDYTGDLGFLFERRPYFKDGLAMRSRDADEGWTPAYGNKQRTRRGDVYCGTVLEHLLVQNLAAFYNVGDRNNVRLENADWNDALDMAPDKGETVAFTSFYAGNLLGLAGLLRELGGRGGMAEIEIAEELCALLDAGADYGSAEAKRAVLRAYCRSVRHDVSGKKAAYDIGRLADILDKMGAWLAEHIRKNELVESAEGREWFNGYYDGKGQRVEGETPRGVRMTLTGQVFPLMAGVAARGQAEKAAAACRRYLYDGTLGGWRLNTDFGELKLDLGRCFGFAYGHKENGSVFSHMAVMYAFALYRQGLAAEGYEVIQSLYRLSADFERARIYPGIPEYFDNRGRGMYCYLTGSASWLMLTLLSESYGVRGRLGDLVLEPKLMPEQFGRDGRAGVRTAFAGRKLRIVYRNDSLLEWGAYGIGSVAVGGRSVEFRREGGAAVVGRDAILALDAEALHDVDVVLVAK